MKTSALAVFMTMIAAPAAAQSTAPASPPQASPFPLPGTTGAGREERRSNGAAKPEPEKADDRAGKQPNPNTGGSPDTSSSVPVPQTSNNGAQ